MRQDDYLDLSWSNVFFKTLMVPACTAAFVVAFVFILFLKGDANYQPFLFTTVTGIILSLSVLSLPVALYLSIKADKKLWLGQKSPDVLLLRYMPLLLLAVIAGVIVITL